MIADDLSRIAMSSGLGESLGRAMELARGRGHVEVTLEHMLLSLCEDPDAGLVLAASNVDLAELRAGANHYVEKLEIRSASGPGIEPGVSSDLRRILEAAAAAARGGRRREINGAIVLAAVVGDGRSPAAQLLQAQGLTFEGAIRALQRSAGAAPPSPAPTNTEDILASARQRVQSRFGPPRARKPAVEEIEPAPEPAAPKPSKKSSAEDAKAAPAEVEAAAPAKNEPARAKKVPPPPRQELPDLAVSDDLTSGEADGSRADPKDDEQAVAAAEHALPPPPPPARPPAFPSTDDARSAHPAPMPPPIPGGDTFAAPSLEAPLPPPSADTPTFPPPGRREVAGGPPPPPPPPPRSQPAALAPPPIPQAPPGDAAPAQPPFERARRPVAPGAPPMASRFGRQVAAHRVEVGQLVENIPRVMRVAIPARVEVRIARADVQALAEGLQGGGAAYEHEVTITKAMSVRLRAPDGGFYIETASPETQWIEKAMLAANDYASWRWHVTPRDKGRKRLQLIISARTVGADGLAAETALPDQVITVRVRTNYAKSMMRWTGWVAAAIIGGLLAKFGEGAFDAGMQVVTKLSAG